MKQAQQVTLRRGPRVKNRESRCTHPAITRSSAHFRRESRGGIRQQETASVDRLRWRRRRRSGLRSRRESQDARATASMFRGEEELFATDRTVSRISEMQSLAYWDRERELY